MSLCIWIAMRLHGYRCGGSGGGMAMRQGEQDFFWCIMELYQLQIHCETAARALVFFFHLYSVFVG